MSERVIKFRYRFRNKKNGEIQGPEIYTLQQIERGEIDWLNLPNQQIEVLSKDQYTGLHDKNGVEIYEGDIIKHSTYKSLSVIVWGISQWCCRVQTPKGQRDYFLQENARQDEWDVPYKADNFEVIGSIHQNPGLLEGEGVTKVKGGDDGTKKRTRNFKQ